LIPRREAPKLGPRSNRGSGMVEIALTGWIEIPEGEQQRLLPLLAEHVRLTLAEPGCVAFAVTPGPDDPDRFDVAERFRDRAALEAHRRRAGDSAWGAATRHLARSYRILETGR
jgi:quinol monooxygenase YgiN